MAFSLQNFGFYASRVYATLACLITLLGCGSQALSQTAAQSGTSTPSSFHCTHLLGFEEARNNAAGTLSIHDDMLRFEKQGKPASEIKVVSIQSISLGGQSREVGGLPMTLGKTAAPFGGGRVVSLFAHKKYDTLTFEYVDLNGALHGAVFQLQKGQGQVVMDALMAKGAHANLNQNEPTKQTNAEAASEPK